MSVTLLVGVWQIVFGLMNAGILAVWLSEYLVKGKPRVILDGFESCGWQYPFAGLMGGAAIHVVTSQIKSMTGLRNLPGTSEPFGLITVRYPAILDDFHSFSVLLVFFQANSSHQPPRTHHFKCNTHLNHHLNSCFSCIVSPSPHLCVHFRSNIEEVVRKLQVPYGVIAGIRTIGICTKTWNASGDIRYSLDEIAGKYPLDSLGESARRWRGTVMDGLLYFCCVVIPSNMPFSSR